MHFTSLAALLSCTLLVQGSVIPYSWTDDVALLSRRQFGSPADRNKTMENQTTQIISNLDQTSFYLSEIRNASIATNETGLRALSGISTQLVDLARDSTLAALVNSVLPVPIPGINSSVNVSLPSLFGNASGTAQAALVSLNASVSTLQFTLGDPTNSTTTSLISQAQQAVSAAWVAFGASSIGPNSQQGGGGGGATPSSTSSSSKVESTESATAVSTDSSTATPTSVSASA